ncbi:MAG: hypothetical protein V3T30_06695, partial [Thermodesulfobacteriota bacterium]
MRTTRQKLIYVAVVAFVVLLLLISYYNRSSPQKTVYSRMQMGTVVEISFPGSADGALSSTELAATAEAGFAEIE